MVAPCVRAAGDRGRGGAGLPGASCCMGGAWSIADGCWPVARAVPAVDELKDVAKSLRRLPVVEPELPTVRARLNQPPWGVLVECMAWCRCAVMLLKQLQTCFTHCGMQSMVAQAGSTDRIPCDPDSCRWRWWELRTWASRAWCNCCPAGCQRCRTTPSLRAASRWGTFTWRGGATRSQVCHGGVGRGWALQPRCACCRSCCCHHNVAWAG